MSQFPATSTSQTFRDRLAATAGEVEAILEELLSDDIRGGEIARPERLTAAMRHAVLAGGKRLRPCLVVEVARIFGVETKAALRAASGIELLHCYSLVHDDLPAMDDDDLRRGRPTVHKAYDEATAILVGDALQTLAFEILADPRTDPDPEIRATLVLGLARAAGLGGMVGGQMLDLAAEGRYGEAALDLEQVRRLQAMKTGALLAFSAEAGAILGRAEPRQREALKRFGTALGAAFQVADDILDREATAESLGKRTGKDRDRGKATLVDLLGLDAARAECRRLVEEAHRSLQDFGPEADILRDAARFAAERRV
ncbi:polyprenyl synthetase family protein [Microvirga massiliensis]|uniref:polyprenyl synthetase family protein n=1 Tax=Microvirga massiliensis TaxID=1033741 RepID=UPI00062BE1DB|nr:farnesyl diphosphate synthase [Microvirga massiliensis]